MLLRSWRGDACCRHGLGDRFGQCCSAARNLLPPRLEVEADGSLRPVLGIHTRGGLRASELARERAAGGGRRRQLTMSEPLAAALAPRRPPLLPARAGAA